MSANRMILIGAAALFLLGACGSDGGTDASTGSASATESATATSASASGSSTTTAVPTPTACHYLVDKNVSNDGDVNVGNFFVLAEFGDAVEGLYWSPYGEDQGTFKGAFVAGRLTGELALEHIEGGGSETVQFDEAWTGSGDKGTLAGYKPVTEADFVRYVDSTGFHYDPCM